MKSRISVAVGALVALVAVAPVIASPPPVTIHLLVHAAITAPFAEPAFNADCEVSVPDGANGGTVLDQAAADGCIAAWANDTAFGARFVTGITGAGKPDSTDGRNTFTNQFLCGAFGTPGAGPKFWSWWPFSIDGVPASVGIDDYAAADGVSVEFTYLVDTCAWAATSAYFDAGGVHADSEVPVEGTAATDPGSL